MFNFNNTVYTPPITYILYSMLVRSIYKNTDHFLSSDDNSPRRLGQPITNPQTQKARSMFLYRIQIQFTQIQWFKNYTGGINILSIDVFFRQQIVFRQHILSYS
jgi:hypothetical protein